MYYSIHISIFQVLVHTVRASAKELLLLIVFLLMGVIVFSSLMFYAEALGHLTTTSSTTNTAYTIHSAAHPYENPIKIGYGSQSSGGGVPGDVGGSGESRDAGGSGDPVNEFDTIPAAFWWALVTMTTIG